MKKIKYFSTFSGIGGFELGIENAAAELGLATECIGFSEVDKLLSQSIGGIFPILEIMVILQKTYSLTA